jgi:hypothetical protein
MLRRKTKFRDRGIAQLVERHPYKVDVIGSSPVAPTIHFF